jgi:ABC-type transport system involved in multi-copper enzyme maturation permease subunit
MSPAMTWTVFRFEIGRILTLPRLAIGAALAAFPPVLMAFMQQQGADWNRPYTGGVVLFTLIPEMVCLMGMLLWATPAVHAELEGKTWAYLAVRPAGKGPILLGKYLAAVAWTATLALLSLTLSVAVVRPIEGTLLAWFAVARLVVLSCFAYGAIFVLLGVLFLRRGMLAAVAYTVVFEVAVSFIPAVINQFTVQYHLRCLLIRWMDWPAVPPSFRALFGNSPWWQHMLILLGITAAALCLAVAVLRQRELVRGDAD